MVAGIDAWLWDSMIDACNLCLLDCRVRFTYNWAQKNALLGKGQTGWLFPDSNDETPELQQTKINVPIRYSTLNRHWIPMHNIQSFCPTLKYAELRCHFRPGNYMQSQRAAEFDLAQWSSSLSAVHVSARLRPAGYLAAEYSPTQYCLYIIAASIATQRRIASNPIIQKLWDVFFGFGCFG